MERKRIAFLDEGRGIGGAEINLLNILAHLDRSRFNPVVIIPGKGRLYERLKVLNIETLIINTPRFLSTSFEWQHRRVCNPFGMVYDIFLVLFKAVFLWFRLRKSKIQILHTNTLFEHIYGGIFARLSNIDCIWYMQDIPSPNFLYGAGKIFMNVSASLLPDKIVAISRSIKDAFSPSVQKKTTVLYIGIDTDAFVRSSDSAAYRSRLGLKPEAFVVAITARLVPWKGHQDFLAAAKVVSQKLPEARFVIVGDTTFGRRHYLKELQDLAKKLGIEDKVIFAGFLEDVRQMLDIADVVAHCSVLPEPFGVSVAEAMAAGKAVVATDIGGPREIIRNGINGILVPPRNPEALSQAIIELLTSASKRNKLGEAAGIYAREQLSNKAFIQGIEKIYCSFTLRILFVHQTWKGFEKTDFEILNKYFKVVDAPLYRNFLFKSFLLFKNIVQSDLVFCWFAYRAAFIVLFLAKLVGKKIIIVAGGWEAANLPDIGYGAMRRGWPFLGTRLITKSLLNTADRIIAISQFNKQELCNNAGIVSEKIVIVYPGIKVDPDKTKAGFEKNRDLILTVGEVNRENMARKGLAVFIETAKLLPEKQFVIVGSKKELNRHIAEPLPPNLQVHEFSQETIDRYYKQAKVYTQLSMHENFGLSLAEAMACECVPVTTDKAALPELVGDTGYYVPYQCPKETAEAIVRAAQDNEKGLKARQRINQFFSIEKREAALVKLLREEEIN